MCESTAYLKKGDQLEKLMENVIFIQPQEDSVFIEDILGEQKTIVGHIQEIELLNHKIVIA